MGNLDKIPNNRRARRVMAQAGRRRGRRVRRAEIKAVVTKHWLQVERDRRSDDQAA